MTDHVPTTPLWIRNRIAESCAVPEVGLQEFDIWFQAEIDAAEQRGAIKALREARQAWYDHADQMTDMPSKYYPAVWLRDRADQMEGDDER